MNFSLHRIALDIHKTVEQLTISCKKNDTARRLLITLTENGFPYSITQDCYAVFTAKKTDGTPIYDDCTIQNNTIIYDLSPKTVSSEGLLECEVTLYGNDGTQITSPRFLLRVYASVVDDDEMESSAEFGALGELVKATNDLINDVNFKLASGAFVGATGSSGVYVGTEEPTDPDITVWINPEEETIPMSADITETDEGIRLSVTDCEGTEEALVKHGKDGRGISYISLGSNGYLTIFYTDGSNDRLDEVKLNDHSSLLNRNTADQHPMAAITGLLSTLQLYQPKGDYMPADAFIPGATSDLSNDSGFITNTVNNLVNYYSKQEVDDRVSSIPKFSIEVVASLPTENISQTTLYLVPSGEDGTSDVYSEYLYTGTAWELLGAQKVDLSGYFMKDNIAQETGSATDKVMSQAAVTAAMQAVLPAVAAVDNGKFLRVENGVWSAVNMFVYAGETEEVTI